MRMMQYNAASAKHQTRVWFGLLVSIVSLLETGNLIRPLVFSPPTMSSKGRLQGSGLGDDILENPTRPTGTQLDLDEGQCSRKRSFFCLVFSLPQTHTSLSLSSEARLAS